MTDFEMVAARHVRGGRPTARLRLGRMAILLLVVPLLQPLQAANDGGRPPPAPATTGGANEGPTSDQLYEAGKALFDQYAPPEIKEQYEFPSKEQWNVFAAKLEAALKGNSLAGLAEYEPQAREALIALRSIPGEEDYAAWLSERLDLIEAAQQAVQERPPPPVKRQRERFDMPYYNLWLHRLRDRPVPSAAHRYLPELRKAFAAEGVPANLAWLAEVESSFNPQARSPAGAVGMFQLMPATAREYGLSTWLPDERDNPKKSARAAAQMLRHLHRKFGRWPLALAAYNAGAGRVSRLLAAHRADSFAQIAPLLPAETRLYVPKIYATIALRTGLPAGQLGGR